MEFFRRRLGRTKDNVGSRRSSRRVSHVSPSNSRRPVTESDAVETPTSNIETVAEAPIAEAEVLEPQAVAEPSEQTTSSRESKSESSEPVLADQEIKSARSEPVATEKIKPRKSQETLTYGVASDVGKLRDNNEDACFAMHWHSITVDERPDFGFFIVADGMGGHLDGEKASGIAVETLAAEMLETMYVPLLRDFHAGDSPTILDALVSASEKANLAVIKRVPGGGTTLSTVAVVDNLAYLVHVGDSRAYLINDDDIEQLTTDHTLVQRLIEMKELTPEEAEYYPQKNVLYRAIGQNEKLKVERLIRTMPPAAQMLICSDGLWDLVEDHVLKQVALESATPQDACDRLIAMANERGGTDNITVIIFKTPGLAPAQ